MEFHPEIDSTTGKAAAVSENVAAKRAWGVHPPLVKRDGLPLRTLTKDQVDQFDRDGFLLIPAAQAWSQQELKLMLNSCEMMGDWPDAPGKWMKYYEPNRNNPQGSKILCRIENFTQYNPGLDFLLNGEKLLNINSDLFGESSILYKEKINYKLPGGDGFAPHQDVAAGWWMYGQTLHISCLVSIDAATKENGCLEVVRGRHMEGLMGDDWKGIPDEKVAAMQWELIPTQPGDVLLFDSYVPHRSAPNNTNASRRVLYATYAKANEGDLRDRYYSDKRASFPPDCERDPNKVYQYKI